MNRLMPRPIKYDFHIHSTFSDGSMPIEEIFALAQIEGISHIAITDHDTFCGYSEIMEASQNYQIIAIPGIEISAYHFETSKKVHLLAYGLTPESKYVEALCLPLLERRTQNTLRQIEAIQNHGYEIEVDEVREKAGISTALYKQHIMAVLVGKGYTRQVMSPLYDALFKGKGIAAGDIKYIDIFEALRAVKQDNGIAVLAHPAMSRCMELLPELLDFGLDGLEVDHPKHTPEEKAVLGELAKQYGLISTGGSDFHGTYGTSHFIGCKEGPNTAPFLNKFESIAKNKVFFS